MGNANGTRNVSKADPRLNEMSSSPSVKLCRIRIAAILVIILGSNSCDGFRDIVKARTRSPDGTVDAVLVEREPGALGATVATPILVYLVKAGDPPREDDLVMQGESFDDLSINWAEPTFLSISYKMGRIFKYRNFWQTLTADRGLYVIEVRLNPTASRSLK